MWFLTFVWKNIFRRKIRAIMTLLGVAIAVGAMVALVGMSADFERSFADIFQKRDVDLLVVKAGVAQRLTSILDESIADRLREVPGVLRVLGGLVDLASFEDGNLIGVTINGVPLESPMIQDPRLVAGRRLQRDDRRAVMLGKTLAQRLNKHVGDRAEIETEDFTVVGIYESYNVYENGAVILRLDEMQQLMDRSGKVSGFVVSMEQGHRDEPSVQAVCRQIKQLRDEHGKPLNLDAQATSDYVSSTVEIRTAKAMAWATSTIALLIGGIAVFNTTVMSVFERTAEIGILRGIGWRRRRIVALILCESALLSLFGGLFGVTAALAVVRLLGWMPQTAGVLSGHVSSSVMFQGTFLGLLLGVVAGVYPALRAAMLTPTEAIRHE